MKRLLPLLLMVAMTLGLASVAFAQGSTTATLAGRILNDAGAPMQGATVVAIHTPTGSKYGSVVNQDGYFRLPYLQVGGPYTVSVTYVGYADNVQEGIYLGLGQTFRQNFTMREEAVTMDAITITSQTGDIFDGNRTGAQTKLGTKEIDVLPSVTRDFLQDYVRLDPRTAPASRESANSGGISVAGTNNRYNAIFIDGAVNNDVFGLANSGTNGGQAGITPISPDAIAQISVDIAPFDVKKGGFSGAGINAVTRSGTNTLEGSAYYFFRNQNLSGRTPGELPDGVERTRLADFTAQTGGFRIGGPIKKDKLFFFFNAEVQRDQEPKPFDFVDYQGRATEADFTRLENFLQSEYGYDAGGYRNNTSTRNGEKFLAKLNWNINDNHKLMLRHSYVRGVERDANRSDNQNVFFFNTGVLFPSTTNSTALELKSTFGDNLFNDLIIGATTVRDDRDVLGDSPFPQVQAFDDNAIIYFGTDNFSYSNIVFQDVFTLTNNLTLTKGRHTFTVGTHNEFFNIQNLFTIFSTPRYQYFNDVDDQGNITRTGLEKFLDGDPGDIFLFGHEQPTTPGDASQIRFGDEAENLGPTFSALQMAFYAQDEIEVSDQFKLTIGLRADIPVFLEDPPLDNTAFNSETIPLIENAGYDLEGAQASKAPGTQILWAPRIGFNLDVTGDQTTQIRGGVGVFTSRVPWVWPGGMFIRNGLNSSFSFRAGFIGNMPEFTPNQDEWRNFANLGSPSGDVDLFAEDFRYPQVLRTSLAIDQKLPGDFIFTAEGIFSRNLNDINIQNVNLKPSTGNLSGTGDTRPTFNFEDRLDPTYERITYVSNTNLGYTYNVTAQLQKPFAKDWTANIAYSYTDAVGLFDGFGFINSTNWRENQSIMGRNSAAANMETTRTIFASGSRISAFLAKRFEYGNAATTVSIFYNGQDGQRYSYVYGNGAALTNEDDQQNVTLMYVPANQDDIVFADPATADAQWAALDAFISADDYLNSRRGEYAERNKLRTPFEHTIDMKLVQDVWIENNGTRHNLQITFDVFNVANLLNSAWGARNFVGNRGNFALLRFVDFEEDGMGNPTTVPTFAFDAPQSNPWTLLNSGLRSGRWASQLGIRYSF
ncbi:MAG: carboxypeptidase regulatory-like domain-containing protein [Bacteroidota bacterium]